MVPILISREMIKPSSPTPQHLQKVKLSYLDQLMSPAYVSIIFFYQADDHDKVDHVRKSQRLKQSLSHALTSFYLLAGRLLQDNCTIDCNDAGVEFIDARAAGDDHAPLKDGGDDRDHYLKERYLPMDPTTTAGGGETREMPFFLVKVTYFDRCGGIAVGVRFMHRIADCASIMDFIRAWARANNHHGEITDDIQTPGRLINFDLGANYFPGSEFPFSGFFMPSGEKSRTKRFLFDKVKLSALRRLAGDVVERPTRVELVTAFIWKCFVDAHLDVNDDDIKQKIFAACHSVNLRPRKKIIENVFGNCFMLALAFEDGGADQFHDFSELVRKWRSAIRVVNENYITESSSERGGDTNYYLNDVYNIDGLITKGHVEWCAFTSWCGFAMYEVDFGWGKPIWWCPVGLPKDFTVFVKTRCGEGIEAWVNMDRDIISSLEAKIQ